MNIAIFCVTYHSYNELNNYAQSLKVAANIVANSQFKACSIDVHVADNTDKEWSYINIESQDNIQFHIHPDHQNLGYFGAVSKMMKSVDLTPYQYVIISNVDVEAEPDMFIQLCEHKLMPDTGWVAPAILSQLEKRDRNPSVMRRYPLLKLKLLRFMFQHPLLHQLQYATIYKRKKLYSQRPAQQIYAGHGSYIILTNEYIKRCGKIDYPVFLYCEEIYLAEMCRTHGLTVMYNPTIKVVDKEHVSTGKMRRSAYYKYNYDAINYILSTFYQ